MRTRTDRLRRRTWVAGALAVALSGAALFRAALRRELAFDATCLHDGPKGERPTALAYSPSGTVLATGWSDGAVRVYTVPREGPPALELLAHAGAVVAVAVSPEGQLVASAGRDGRVRCFSAKDGASVGTIVVGAAVTSIAASPSGDLLAVASGDGAVRLWTLPGGDLVRVLEGPPPGPGATRVAWSADGLLGVVTGDSLSTYAPARGRKAVARLPVEASVLAFSPDGERLAWGSVKGALRVARAATLELLASPRESGPEVTSLAFSPAGKLLAVGGPGGAAVVAIAKGWPPLVLRGQTAPVRALAVSASGRLAVASDDGAVSVWLLPWD